MRSSSYAILIVAYPDTERFCEYGAYLLTTSETPPDDGWLLLELRLEVIVGNVEMELIEEEA